MLTVLNKFIVAQSSGHGRVGTPPPQYP